MTLNDLKKGDVVALYRQGELPQRLQVDHCTDTRIIVNNKQYTKKGYVVGALSDPKFHWYGHNEWIEVWDKNKYQSEIERNLMQRRLKESRIKLADFPWNEVTQEQADAVFAAMQAAGMFEDDK